MSSLAQAERPARNPVPAGGVHFAAAARHEDLCVELRARRYLVTSIAPAIPGRLRQAIEDAVEGALAMRGALPPAVEVGAALEPTIRDQVFRARALGATGLALSLPLLGDAADGTLDATDGDALSLWLSAARGAPLVLVLDERDRGARVLTPVPIGDLAGPSPLALNDSTPPPSGEVETTLRPVVETTLRPEVEATVHPEIEARTPPAPVVALTRRGVMKKRSALRLEAAGAAAPEPPKPETPEPPRTDPAAVRNAAALMPPVPPIETATPAPPVVEPPVVEEREEIDLVSPAPAKPAVRRSVDAAEWRGHAIELDKARGPKPVSVIEKLFASRYMPLVGAAARGEADQTVRGVMDAWRTSFEHSYREAFSALRVTGKRPPMVFDAPDIAARIGRLNGARATKLMLVDAMRFDVGERVADRLKERLTGRAVCVERLLLWSALPTTTPTQMGLLGRGPDGLRDAEPESTPEPEIVRGRAVGTVRRERVGSREVMKLDVVEARMRNAGPGYDDRLDAIADEVAPILVKYIETLPPRTLLFMFGDHGFRLQPSADGRGTAAATQGGVSPEEVLVPGQAWLVGGVH